MSIKNTILGQIVKQAKIRWDKLSEDEADKTIEEIKTPQEARETVTYNSDIKAIDGIAKIIELDKNEIEFIIDDIGSKSEIRRELAEKIKNGIQVGNKYEKIIEILSVIHNEWVKNNANKFMARPKDYQFVDLRLLSYEEAQSDLIFVKPILETCGIDIDEKELKRQFLNLQKQFLDENNIDSHEKLVDFLIEGAESYSTLKGLETDKGIGNGENYSIEELLKDREIAEQMANQIEIQIADQIEPPIFHQKTDLHTHLNAVLPSEVLADLVLTLLGRKIDPKILELKKEVNNWRRLK